MAKKKRRRSKKNKGNLTLAVMLGVMLIIIGAFVFKALDKNDGDSDGITTTASAIQGGDYDSSDGEKVDAPDDSQGDYTETVSTTEEKVITTFEELTTEPLTLPMNSEPENMVDAILSYYTDLMGFPEGALFIKESETEETAGGYTYTLRLNTAGSPNELVGDVYVEKGTGRVTDSMGNEAWNIGD